MRAVLQRVKNAKVEADGKITAFTKNGLLVLAGIEKGDSEKDLAAVAQKLTRLRIFSDSEDRLNLAVYDVEESGIIIVSNFTLMANCKHGRRPDFLKAEEPKIAKEMYNKFVSLVKKEADIIKREKGLAKDPYIGEGVFAADMQLTFTNDGPITIILDSKELL